MSAGAGHAMIIANAATTRRLRRLAPIPLVTGRMSGAVMAAAVVLAVGFGVWAGAVLSALGIAAGTAIGAVCLVGMVTGLGAGAIWGEVRAGFVETCSWRFYADRGVSARTFLLGRHLVARALRLVVPGCAALSALVILSAQDAGDPPSVTAWLTVLLAPAGAAACGIAYASLRSAPVRSAGATVGTSIAITAFASCGAMWTARWVGALVSAATATEGSVLAVVIAEPEAVPLWAASAVVLAAAVVAYARCRALNWPMVVERNEGIERRASNRASGMRGGRRIVELSLLDLRRAMRAFEWRVRPGLYTVLAMALAVAMLGGLGSWLAPDLVARIAGSAVGATVIGGVCSGYAFVVFSSLAPLVSLDADRGASALMRTFPQGIRSLAAARAATGAFVTGGAGALFIGLLTVLAPIGSAAVGTAAVACAVVSVLAPVSGCFVSVRYPQTEWKEASEIGQRGWARVIATYAVGAAIATSITLASSASWSVFAAAALVSAMPLLCPLLAAGITAALPTTIGVSHRSRH